MARLRFDIISIFPHVFESYLQESLFKRAVQGKLIEFKLHDLRSFSTDKRHHKVDERPFGGGPGMVFQVEPIYRAVTKILGKSKKKKRVILFSLRGKKLDSATAKRLAKFDQLVFVCGRYEGVDERVAEHIADEELSIGDYVLAGGELPALVTMEAISRYIPGFLGKYESLEDVKGSYPVYSRPEVFKPKRGKSWPVPKVLLSGDHAKIKGWRERS